MNCRLADLSTVLCRSLRRFEQLSVKAFNRKKQWDIDQDINLLKGFQVFGPKFNMIKMYFLPDRHKTVIRNRLYTALLKTALTVQLRHI